MKFTRFFAICFFLLGFQANANMIEISLDKMEVAPNDILNVTLLAEFTDPVDEFDFDFIFDTSIFSYVDGSASTDLPNDGFDAFFEIAANPTGLGLGFIDFVSSLDGGYFVSFALLAEQAGQSSFDLEVNTLSSFFFGEDYVLTDVDTQSASVPAPAALGLFIIGLVALVKTRRTR